MSNRQLLLINFITALGFLFVYSSVTQAGLLHYLDTHINLLTPTIWTPAAQKVVLFFSSLTRPVPAIIIALVFAVWLIYQNKWKLVTLMLVSIPTAAYSSVVIKSLIEKERPVDALIQEVSFTFPSTHATIGGLLAGSIWIIHEECKSSYIKYIIGAVVLVISLFLGASRIYLGVHWLSDVLAGYLLGIFWASLFLLIYKNTTFQK